MPRVKVKAVTLSGFGPHRGKVKYSFSGGVNVWVAPNESGKSTLVAGIGAIIFGIPQTTDVAVFGQARYRNWGHPPEFAGELICEVDGETYRIQRDFDSNHVSLAQLTDGQYRELAGGTHNPRAQRRNRRYEELIQSLFGLSSQDLFEATFCLTQPLPEEEEIDEKVQGLLSGSGTGFHLIAEKLADELRAITRFTGRRGVTARDAANPRELEELEADIARIKQAIVEDRAVVDRLETLRRTLEAQERLREEEQKAYREQEQLLRQWTEWQRLRESYYAAQRFFSQVSKAKEQARKLAEERKQVAEEKEGYAWGPALPEATGELITELQALQEQKSQLLKRIQELEAELATPLAEEREPVEEDATEQPDWEVFGPHPVTVLKRLRRQAEEALTDWASLQQIRAAEEECRTTLEEEYALFNRADEATLEAVKAYRDRQARLRAAVESAALKLKAAQTERQKAERRRIYRLVTAVVLAAVGGGLAARFGGGWGLPFLVLAILGGAGTGYLLGRLCFPAGNLGILRHQVSEGERNLAHAQEENANFTRIVKPFADQFPDPAAACQRWEKFRTDWKSMSDKIQEFNQRELGGFPGPAENCSLADGAFKMAGRWRELRDLAQATGAGAGLQLLGELVAWLQTRTNRWWEELIARAEDYEAKAQAALETRAKREVSSGQLAKERSALAEVEKSAEQIAGRLGGLLAAANGDLEQARRLWQSWRDLTLREEKIDEALRNLLDAQGVASLEELEGKSDDAALRAQAEYQAWQRLIAAHPGLPGADEVTNLPKIEEDFRRIQQEAGRRQDVLSRIDQEILRLSKELAQVEGEEPVNIAVAELQLEEMEERRAELLLMSEALTLAYQELTAATNDFQRSYRQRLAESVSAYYRNLTGNNRRTVEISEDFRVTVNEDGRCILPAQLSHGARDQLYIALRMGIARLLAAETVLPFIFDDPFLNCDAERLGKIRYSLEQLAKECQIILLSHREDFLTWGTPVGVEMVRI